MHAMCFYAFSTCLFRRKFTGSYWYLNVTLRTQITTGSTTSPLSQGLSGRYFYMIEISLITPEKILSPDPGRTKTSSTLPLLVEVFLLSKISTNKAEGMKQKGKLYNWLLIKLTQFISQISKIITWNTLYELIQFM